ncbi:heavy-metal-associated domain-containing protein [Candidatus Roizmanbacteria bacterium]|nr:heavy-metal-associated domain-containing protein [Candidatus Roizmanbacteria bacterium]
MAKKVKLKIIGMHCTSCAMNIDGDLEDFVKGVKCSNTSYAKQETDVEFDGENVKVTEIIEQIRKTGYQAIPLD